MSDNFYRDSHYDLTNIKFVERFCEIIHDYLISIEENWEKHSILLNLIIITKIIRIGLMTKHMAKEFIIIVTARIIEING